MANWQRDGIHVLLGLTLALAFLGFVTVLGGILFLLMLLVAPASIQQLVEPVGPLLRSVLLLLALAEVLIWNVLPTIGFASPQLARRLATVMAVAALLLVISLLFAWIT
jgi:hypothetical protein